VPGFTDEPLVLGLRDGVHGDAKVIEVDPVGGPFVVVGVARPHQELTRRDQRHFRQKVSSH
jgi:hypothetical protein